MGVSDRCDMTWEGGKRRWRKMVGGRVYTVSCKALGVPGTKHESYQAANAWLAAKLVTIHPQQDEISRIERRRDWAARHGEQSLASDLASQAATIRDDPHEREDEPVPPFPIERIEVARAFGIVVPEDIDPYVAEQIFGDGRVWADRLRRDARTPSVRTTTIGELAADWLTLEQTRVTTGKLKPRSFANSRPALNQFVDFVGSELPPEAITEKTVDGLYTHLVTLVGQGDISPSNATFRFATANRFIRWLWEQRKLELPRNLDRPRHFGNGAPKIETFTVEEVRRLFSAATGQTRLHLALMMNCGMYPTDIAALQDSEVDWTAGRIIRKRTKTAKHANVPCVNYLLWGPTFAWLKEYRSGGPTVLLTRSGEPWDTITLGADGKLRGSNKLTARLTELWEKLNIRKPPKCLRKTGATMLREQFPGYESEYLGHAPKGMAARHYSNYSQAGFDAAVSWLGESILSETSALDTAPPSRR